MVTIKVNCPECHEKFELTSEDIFLMIEEETGKGYYFFDCHVCEDKIGMEANERTIRILMAAGAYYEIIARPEPPIGEKEVASFVVDLDGIEEAIEKEL